MIVLMKILQVILALSVLIIIHEAGHFFWARVFGIRVDKFYLFFDLGGKKLFSFKKGDTEYGVGWLPLGGYCKIAGMIDESMDTESLKGDLQSWEFRSKPAWQRLLVMAGGVINNFILAIVLFCAILAIWGDNYVSARHPVYASELAQEMGFRTGDVIINYDGYEPKDFTSLQSDLARRRVSSAQVLRGADTLTIYIDQSMMGDVVSTPGMFDIALEFVVDSVMTTSPNVSVLERGDRIVSVAGEPSPYLQDAQKVLRAHPGEQLSASVLRGVDTLSLPLQVDSLGMLGVFFRNDFVSHRDYSIGASIPAGCALAWNSVTGYLRDLRLVATPSTGAYKSVGSFVAIGEVFPSAWDWHQFLYILAMLSIMLGVMNLLPIPALDGGHIVFCLYEIFTGRKPSDRFLAVAQMIGMLLLILLMLLAFGNDFARLLH
mgnify:CR=1 FL=1